MSKRDFILKQAVHLFSRKGYEGVSMRELAKQIPMSPSVLYHYFPDKDTLLKDMFTMINAELGQKRMLLSQVRSAGEMLKQRIRFQLENAEEIVAVLKYYLAYRKWFKKTSSGGYVPDKTYLHIEEVLQYGVKTGEFTLANIQTDAKVITHAINGFLLEYFPKIPAKKEQEKLVQNIYSFLIRSLKPESTRIKT